MKKLITCGILATIVTSTAFADESRQSKRQQLGRDEMSLEQFLDGVSTPVKIILWTSAIVTPIAATAIIVNACHNR